MPLRRPGFDIGEVYGGIEDFATKVAEKNQNLIDSYKLLGLNVKDMLKKNINTQFEIFLNKVSAVEDNTKRIQILNFSDGD